MSGDTDSLSVRRVPLWLYKSENDKTAIKKKKKILSSTGPEERVQRGREGGGLRSFTEACLRVVAVVGRNKLNSTKIVAFHEIHSFSLPSGLQRSDGDAANNQE